MLDFFPSQHTPSSQATSLLNALPCFQPTFTGGTSGHCLEGTFRVCTNSYLTCQSGKLEFEFGCVILKKQIVHRVNFFVFLLNLKTRHWAEVIGELQAYITKDLEKKNSRPSERDNNPRER
jgi:hypothetical protein